MRARIPFGTDSIDIYQLGSGVERRIWTVRCFHLSFNCRPSLAAVLSDQPNHRSDQVHDYFIQVPADQAKRPERVSKHRPIKYAREAALALEPGCTIEPCPPASLLNSFNPPIPQVHPRRRDTSRLRAVRRDEDRRPETRSALAQQRQYLLAARGVEISCRFVR